MISLIFTALCAGVVALGIDALKLSLKSEHPLNEVSPYGEIP